MSVLFVAVTDNNSSSMIWRGDFPGFYGPAWQVFGDHSAHSLYNPEAQRLAQNKFFPSLQNNFYYFAYPPFTTILYAPFLFFNPMHAKILCSLLMFCCSFVAFFLITKQRLHQRTILIGSVAFFPLFIANVCAQNTGITIILLAGYFWFINKNSLKTDILAGIAAALLAYKPQFGLFLVVLLIIFNNHRALFGMGAGVITLYLSGAMISGNSWPLEWFTTIRHFNSLNYENNLSQLCSISAMIFSLCVELGIEKTYVPALSLAGAIIAFLSMTFVVYLQKKNGISWRISFFLFISSIPLISPQTLFYDIGIALFGFGGLMAYEKKHIETCVVEILIICTFGLLCEVFRHYVNFPIYSVLSVLIFVMALYRARRITIYP